jgi:hypothetical protein
LAQLLFALAAAQLVIPHLPTRLQNVKNIHSKSSEVIAMDFNKMFFQQAH